MLYLIVLKLELSAKLFILSFTVVLYLIVLKLQAVARAETWGFYSSVIFNSTETFNSSSQSFCLFYSSVIFNSTETEKPEVSAKELFYSSVILLSKLLGNYNSRRYY